VYPFVSTEKLIERVKTREAETGQKGADEATILNSVYAAQDNIVGLIGDIDELFIYDNNGSKGAETVLVHVVVGDNGYSVYDCAQDKRYFCKTVKKFTDKLRELLLGFCGCED
jgi:predicted ABC-type ATPase